MSFRVIVTVGPALRDPVLLQAVAGAGPVIFRINGAHVSGAEVPALVAELRAAVPDAPIMVDLAGNKIRTQGLAAPIPLAVDATVTLGPHQTNLPTFARYLSPGTVILASDGMLQLEVLKVCDDTFQLRALNAGILGNNKGLHTPGIHGALPFLFPRDTALIDAAVRAKVAVVSLSFVRNVADIQTARAAIAAAGGGHAPALFAKIETAAALANLDAILAEVQTVNIDRGDLAADIGLRNLSAAQAQVIARARARGREIFLATQFLKHMEVSAVPLISEVTALHQAIASGISGVQLSEETAVGQHPLACVQQVFDTLAAVHEQSGTAELLLAA